MVKTTQEYVDGAAARFAADNANDDTVAALVLSDRIESAIASLSSLIEPSEKDIEAARQGIAAMRRSRQWNRQQALEQGSPKIAKMQDEICELTRDLIATNDRASAMGNTELRRKLHAKAAKLDRDRSRILPKLREEMAFMQAAVMA